MSKKFAFRYQNLLEIKEKYEEIARQRLNEALMVLDKEKRQLDFFENEKRRNYDLIRLETENGVVAGQLRSYNSYLNSISKNIELQKEIVKQYSNNTNELRLVLMNAAKEKKTFENLKEKAKEYYEYDEKKEEEKFVDQLVTFNNYKGI